MGSGNGETGPQRSVWRELPAGPSGASFSAFDPGDLSLRRACGLGPGGQPEAEAIWGRGSHPGTL